MKLNQYELRLSKERTPVLASTGFFSLSDTARMNTPAAVVSMMEDFFYLSEMAEEYVYLIALNSVMIPVAIFEISHGCMNQSILSPREVFLRILLCGATGMILLHNHPCGTLLASKDDRDVFDRLQFSAKMLGIQFVDFIILGNGFLSFRSEGFFG